ncbi:hypothetical protein A2645_01265 [Candidatus Nomurabacteria bacterium RIFCSPHIGHO2_01_FULL_39_9]|uniref:Uncharacterized protein n=1 Tax=Candidatus Nomurabacteria bacterium RIFCSPHIGHO2_01_FULL_39_9 TaxID=1801735 RepID=A0A1F6UWP0_9BACT|nr:MAG: hypothetical protein A2645_01265 [Candidatus Nomurabacteria bacterium RIFCSPHIGHO2_01_FULL_39_9]
MKYFFGFGIIIFLIGILFSNSIKKTEAAFSSGDGLIVYGTTNVLNFPQFRLYSSIPNIFSVPQNTVSGPPAHNVAMQTSPKKLEAIAGYTDESGVLHALCYDGINWTSDWSDTVGGNGKTRRFDIGYESATGDAVVLYSRGVAGSNELAYRIKSGTSGCGSSNWSAAANFDSANSTGIIDWVKIARDRRTGSSILGAIWADQNQILSGALWNGSIFTNEPAGPISTNLQYLRLKQDLNNFDLEFESNSGNLMIVWGDASGNNGTNGVRYIRCTGGIANCAWSVVQTPAGFADDASSLDISANLNSNEIVFGSIGAAGNDLQVGYWNGANWSATPNLDTTTGPPFSYDQIIKTGWLSSGGTSRSIIVYEDTNNTTLSFVAGNQNNFTIQPDFTPAPLFNGAHEWYDIDVDSINKNQLMFTVNDNNSDLYAERLFMDGNGNFTWTNGSGGNLLDQNLTNQNTGNFTFRFWNSVSTGEPLALTFNISNNSIGFGDLSVAASRFATSDGLGFATEIEAHNFSVTTNAPLGYRVLILGDSPSLGSFSIDPIGVVATSPVPGTEQFGLRIIASGGSGLVSSPYNTSDFAYAADAMIESEVASANIGDNQTTTYSARYMANISPITPAGQYATVLTFVATANF